MEKKSKTIEGLLNLFLQEARAFGVFSSNLNLKAIKLEQYFDQRLTSIGELIRAFDEVFDIPVSDSSYPIIYNTQNWPSQAPIAGYVQSGYGLKYGHLLISYMGNWKYEYENGSHQRRVERAGFYMWLKSDAERSIDYLFDLLRYGYFIYPQTILQGISQIIDHSARGNTSEQAIKMYFGGSLPKNTNEWINRNESLKSFFPKVKEKVFRNNQESISKELLETILLKTISTIQGAKQTNDPTEWMLEQAYIFSRCEIVIDLFKRYQVKKSLALESILDQFEEIRADGGPVSHPSLKQKYSPLKNPLLTHSSTFLKLFRIKFGHEEGENRFYNERVGYPSVLRSRIQQPYETWDLKEWGIVPPRLQFAFTFTRGTGVVSNISRTILFPVDDLLRDPRIQQFFDEVKIQDKKDKIALLNEIYYHDDFGSWKYHPDQVEKLNREKLLLMKSEFEKVIWQVHSDLCQTEIINLLFKHQLSDTLQLENHFLKILELYPYHPSVYLETAIFYSKQSNPEGALQHILTSILLDINSSLNWQSYSIILSQLGNENDAKIAWLIKQVHEQSEKNNA